MYTTLLHHVNIFFSRRSLETSKTHVKLPNGRNTVLRNTTIKKYSKNGLNVLLYLNTVNIALAISKHSAAFQPNAENTVFYNSKSSSDRNRTTEMFDVRYSSRTAFFSLFYNNKYIITARFNVQAPRTSRYEDKTNNDNNKTYLQSSCSAGTQGNICVHSRAAVAARLLFGRPVLKTFCVLYDVRPLRPH